MRRVDGDSAERSGAGQRRSATWPWSSSWVGHYDKASRRRHRLGGYRRLRADAKRKRRVERVVVVVVAASVLGLVAIFNAILSS
jgi:hypothetical protein